MPSRPTRTLRKPPVPGITSPYSGSDAIIATISSRSWTPQSFSATAGSDAALVALSIAVSGFIAVRPLFWTFPPGYLADRAAAGSIALIRMGNLGGFLAPNVKVWADELEVRLERAMCVTGVNHHSLCNLRFGRKIARRNRVNQMNMASKTVKQKYPEANMQAPGSTIPSPARVAAYLLLQAR